MRFRMLRLSTAALSLWRRQLSPDSEIPTVALESSGPRIAFLYTLDSAQGFPAGPIWEHWFKLATQEEKDYGDFLYQEDVRLKGYLPEFSQVSGIDYSQKDDVFSPVWNIWNMSEKMEGTNSWKVDRCGSLPKRASVYVHLDGPDIEDFKSKHLGPESPLSCAFIEPVKGVRSENKAARYYALLEEALKDPRNVYFVMIPEGSMFPMKIFKELFEYLLHDDRSLLDVTDQHYANFVPKHSGYMILVRRHAEFVVRDGPHGLMQQGSVKYKNIDAKSEEVRPAMAMSKVLGRELLWKEINGKRVPPFAYFKRGYAEVPGSQNYELDYIAVPGPRDDTWVTTIGLSDMLLSKPDGLSISATGNTVDGINKLLAFVNWLAGKNMYFATGIDQTLPCDFEGNKTTVQTCVTDVLNVVQNLENEYNNLYRDYMIKSLKEFP